MASAARSPSPDVNLRTVELVQAVLEDAEGPVSRYYIRKQLERQGHATVPSRLNRALEFFFLLGLAVEGSKGIQWTHTTSPSLLRALATGKRL